MLRLPILFVVALVSLVACAPTERPLGPDGRPLPTAYVIKPGDEGRVTYSMVDSINALRSAAGVQPLTLNPLLTAAAATHSRDMALQNRAWDFGSDGSSAILRAQRTGYQGRMIDENVAESYETELETLSAWMERPGSRTVILNPAARDVGFAWFQEKNGKIWWTLVTGS